MDYVLVYREEEREMIPLHHRRHQDGAPGSRAALARREAHPWRGEGARGALPVPRRARPL